MLARAMPAKALPIQAMPDKAAFFYCYAHVQMQPFLISASRCLADGLHLQMGKLSAVSCVQEVREGPLQGRELGASLFN